MSDTTSMHCKDCKESMDIGRRRYIWADVPKQSLFFHRHMGHHLVFMIDGCYDEYNSYSAFEDLPKEEQDPDNCFIDGEYNYDHN